MNWIAVLGNANMDFVVRQPRLPRSGETIVGSGFSIEPGGRGLNQAVAAARMGAVVDFVGMVGSDQHGEQLRGVLETEGIRADGLDSSFLSTGTAHIAVVDSGVNSIVVVPGANADLTWLSPVQRAHIGAAAFLVLQCELPMAVLAEGLAVAREAGVFTVLTPAPVVALPDGLPDGFLDLVDLVVPNQVEAAQLTGESDPVRAAEILSAGGTWAIVTLGAEGAVVAFDGAVLGLAPARPVQIVDTSAAGDTFVGALVARLAAGAPRGRADGTEPPRAEADGAEPRRAEAGRAEPPRAEAGRAEPLRAEGIPEAEMIDAVRWATVAASVSITRPGAITSMPTLAEVTAILA